MRTLLKAIRCITGRALGPCRPGHALALLLISLVPAGFIAGCLEPGDTVSTQPGSKDTTTIPKDTSRGNPAYLDFRSLVPGDSFQYELIRRYYMVPNMGNLEVTDTGTLTLHIDSVDTVKRFIRFQISTILNRKYHSREGSDEILFDSLLTDTRSHESAFCLSGLECVASTTDTFYRFFPSDSLPSATYPGHVFELEGSPIDYTSRTKEETAEGQAMTTENYYSKDLDILIHKRWSRLGQFRGPPFYNGWLTLKSARQGKLVVKLP